MTKGSTLRKNHTAAGPAAGYFFQPEVALKMLTEADAEASIAIEADDDITECIAQRVTQRSQLKHQTVPHGAFTDSSVDLWKTLSIWTTAAHAKEFNTKICKLVLVTNGTVSDCFIRKTVDAKAKERKLLIDTALDKKYAATVEPYVEIVRQHDRKLVYSVFACIGISDARALAGKSVKSRAISNLHLSDSIDPEIIYDGLLGWIHKTTIDLWRNQQLAWISKKSFSNQYQAMIRRYNQFKKIGIPAHLINVSPTARDSEINRLFVKQLRSVKADEKLVTDAIIDFIRCNTERVRLAHEGELTGDDWIDFDSSLEKHWLVKERISRLSPQPTPEDTGLALYLDSLLHEAEIAGDKVQGYLTSGSFHRLANQRAIGWHPNYKTLFPDADDANTI